MCHFFDGSAQVPGLLQDQAHMGIALLRASEVSSNDVYLERARQLAEFILAKLRNAAGGFYDIPAEGTAALRNRLLLIEQNGAAASFFLGLAAATGEENYRQAAESALCSFTGDDFAQYGVHAAPFGSALGEFLTATLL